MDAHTTRVGFTSFSYASFSFTSYDSFSFSSFTSVTSSYSPSAGDSCGQRSSWSNSRGLLQDLKTYFPPSLHQYLSVGGREGGREAYTGKCYKSFLFPLLLHDLKGFTAQTPSVSSSPCHSLLPVFPSSREYSRTGSCRSRDVG